MLDRTTISVAAVFGALTFAGGTFFGYEQGKSTVENCGTCCLSSEECIDADEWALGAIGQIDDQAVSEEYSRMWNECQAELERNPCVLQLAECRGALAECRRE